MGPGRRYYAKLVRRREVFPATTSISFLAEADLRRASEIDVSTRVVGCSCEVRDYTGGNKVLSRVLVSLFGNI